MTQLAQKLLKDEFHQAFVLNRGPVARDVFIDSAGALVGILIYLGIKKLMYHYQLENK